MTKNQIEYAKLVETKRTNLANEALTRERDSASKQLGFHTLEEQKRSNKAKEVETAQHNRATEGLEAAKLGEASRHNAQLEALQAMGISETGRHNLAQERTAAKEADTHAFTAQESQRSNLARENETQRSNVARETETNRSNTANEAIAIAAGVTTAGRLAEDIRQHLAREAETRRHNMAMEVRPVPNAYVNVSNSQNASPQVNVPQGNTNVQVAQPNVAVEVPTTNTTNTSDFQWPRNVVQAVDWLVEDAQSLGSKFKPTNPDNNRSLSKTIGGKANEGQNRKRKR